MSKVVEFALGEQSIGKSRRPKRFNIEAYQGDTFPFYLRFLGVGLDTTGWTASASVKKASDKTLVPGVITISDVDIAEDRFLINVTTESLDPEEEYVYDVQVMDAATPPNKRTFIAGKIITTEDVTEP